MGTENLSLFDKWFKIADEDGDGKITGGEAVKFFQRSGLPQPCLAEVWQLASNGAPSLGKPQFNGAMQLVSLAQQNGGAFNQQVARQVIIGLGPKLPPPRMQGLAAPAQQSPGGGGVGGATMPSWGGLGGGGGAFPTSGATGGYFTQPGGHQHMQQQQPGGGIFPASGPTGALMPGHMGGGGFPVSGSTGGIPPRHPPPQQQQGGWGGGAQMGFQQQQQQHYPSAGMTGGYSGGGSSYPTSGPTGSLFPSSAPAGSTGGSQYGGSPSSHPSGHTGGLPPMQPAEEQQYAAIYARLDPQRTGAVQGGVVFPVFSSSGLPREALRDIWALVAGNKSALSQQEFVGAHYLIDCARRGLRLPQQLPPGPFPPRAGVGSPSPHSSPAYQPPLQQQPPSLSLASGPGGAPHMMQQQQQQQQPPSEDPIAAVNDAFASLGASLGVPQHLVSGGGGAQGREAPRPSCMGPTKDMEAFGVTDPADLPHRKKEFYESSLQELTIFKRRMEGKLVQVEGSSGRAVEEADALEKQSRDLHSAMVEAAESVGRHEQKVEEALQREEEANHLFEELNRRRNKLSSVSLQDVEHDEMVAASVESVVEDSEKQLQHYRDVADGGKSRRPVLEESLLSVDSRLGATHNGAQRHKAEVDALRSQVERSQQAGAASELQAALKATTALHAELLKDVSAAGLPLPSIPPDQENKSGLQWKPDAAAGAMDPKDPYSYQNGNGSNAVASGPPPLFKSQPPQQQQQQPQPQQQQQQQPPYAPGSTQKALFSKGEAVWYVKGGGRVEGTVVSIDLSIQPPSYSVKLPSGERETEEKYLEKRITTGPAAHSFAAAPVNGNGINPVMMASSEVAPQQQQGHHDPFSDPAATFGFEPQHHHQPFPASPAPAAADDPFAALGF